MAFNWYTVPGVTGSLYLSDEHAALVGGTLTTPPPGDPDGSALDAAMAGWANTPTSNFAAILAKYQQRADLGGWPFFVYGNSYGILTAGWFTGGKHYTQRVSSALGGGAVTSYAIGGKRILDVLSALINETQMPGLGTAPIAGGKWPGVSNRQGIVVLESAFNDFGHYSTMVGTAIPAALTNANTRYKDSLRRQYRAALAYLSSESRIEAASWTTSGVWTRGSTQPYASGGLVDFTTAAGAYSEVSVTPPQSGPLAGKVFICGFTVDAGAGTMAPVNITVDGGAPTAYTPPAWEQYTGPAGGAVNVSVDAIAVTVPVDGAAHTVRITHAGAAGNLLYVDCLLVPSTNPDPIMVMGCELGPKAGNIWTAAQVGVFQANMAALLPEVKAAVAEFPHAVYVPSTMTATGLYSGDGIHPNDLGMTQRANDLRHAINTSLKPRLDNRTSESAGGYPVL